VSQNGGIDEARRINKLFITKKYAIN